MGCARVRLTAPAPVAWVLAWFAALAGCDSAPQRAEPPPPKVSVQHPEARQITDYDAYNGWIQSPQVVEIRARVRGHIDSIDFTDGEIVQKGQPLITLDPRPFQQDIDRAKEQVNIVQAQLNVALLEEKRMVQLQKTSAASPLEVDTSEAKARSLESQVLASKKEVERKELELEYSKITAPITGRIGRAQLDMGNLVNAGGSDPLLATIVAIDPVQVYFPVDERSLQRYMNLRKAGNTTAGGAGAAATAATQPVSLRHAKIPFQFGLETDDGYPHEGVLDFADNRIDPTTGTIEVRGVIPNQHGRFVPGSRARVRVSVTNPRPALLVPDTAVLSDQDKKYVLALDDKNVVQRRDVALGNLLDDGMRIIRGGGSASDAGITANDWIITLGLQTARINYPVDPVKPPGATTTQPAVASGQALGQ